MSTDRVVGLARKEHERAGSEGHIRGRIIGGLNREPEAEQAGHDRLNHPLGQAITLQPRGQTEQTRSVVDGLAQGATQCIGLQTHIGIQEQNPITADLLHRSGAGPVLSHPTLAVRSWAGLQDRTTTPTLFRRCTTGKLKGLVVGCIIDNDNRPVGAGSMAPKNAVQTVLDIPSLVEGGNDNGEAGLRKCCVD